MRDLCGKIFQPYFFAMPDKLNIPTCFDTGSLCKNHQIDSLTMAVTDLATRIQKSTKNATNHYNLRIYCLKLYLAHLVYHRNQCRLLWNAKIFISRCRCSLPWRQSIVVAAKPTIWTSSSANIFYNRVYKPLAKFQKKVDCCVVKFLTQAPKDKEKWQRVDKNNVLTAQARGLGLCNKLYN